MSTTLDLRKALLRNGYTPLPNVDKRCMLKGWTTVEVTDAEIEAWETGAAARFTATGLRVDDDLVVVDVDFDDEALVGDLWEAFREIVPAGAPVLARAGRGWKEAWVLRADKPLYARRSAAFAPLGGDDDGPLSFVEVFGGASKRLGKASRQIGAFGWHTKPRAGTPAIEYAWVSDHTPETLPKDALAVVTEQDVLAFLDRAAEIAKRHGYEQVGSSADGSSEPLVAYDLDDTMVFRCNDDIDRSLAELTAAAKPKTAGARQLRCDASFTGARSTNRERCLIGWSSAHGVYVWEPASYTTHYAAKAAPTPVAETMDRLLHDLARRIAETGGDANTDLEQRTYSCAEQLLGAYAYLPAEQRCVVPITLGAQLAREQAMTYGAFKMLFKPLAIYVPGPRGGSKEVSPADLWLASPDRINLGGLRFAPERDRPLYIDQGVRYLNSYEPPAYGDAARGQDGLALVKRFLAHLFPNAAERETVIRWMAHKLRRPEVPGFSLILVADGVYGVGRGTFTTLLAGLLGESYVKTIDYADLTGSRSQSQYNDWQASSLVVSVAEGHEHAASRHRDRVAIYETLKSLIDPARRKVQVRVKGFANYEAWTCCSYIIATNHIDALPIPAHDRRFMVIDNGRVPLTARDDLAGIHAAIADADTLAAVAEWLGAIDLANFDIYNPPSTDAKAEMADASRGTLDRYAEELVERLPGKVTTLPQFTRQLAAYAANAGLDVGRLTPDFEGLVRREIISRYLVRVGPPGREGRVWVGGGVRSEQQLMTLYALPGVDEATVRGMTPQDRADELARNDRPTANGNAARNIRAA